MIYEHFCLLDGEARNGTGKGEAFLPSAGWPQEVRGNQASQAIREG